MGSVGDSYDNALAESVIGLYKTEVIRRRGPWRHLEAVEFATLEWVDWFNNRLALDVDRRRATGRVRTAVLSGTRSASHNGRSQLMSSPENPGRFRHLFKGQYPEVCITTNGIVIRTENRTETNVTQVLMKLCALLDGFVGAESPW